MAIEKRPNHPVPKGYIPPGSKPYKVNNGDTWESVARNYNVDVRSLIYFNFGTGNFAEVNWYLRHYVGCRVETHNRHNWVFTSNAEPGIIHIPVRQVITLPPITISAGPPPKLKEVWAGLAKAHSGDLFVIGAHDLTGKICNLGDEFPNVKNAVINIKGWKLGLGLGGDISAVFVIAYGYTEAKEMVGVDGEWDFDLAIGPKLGDFLKEVRPILWDDQDTYPPGFGDPSMAHFPARCGSPYLNRHSSDHPCAGRTLSFPTSRYRALTVGVTTGSDEWVQ